MKKILAVIVVMFIVAGCSTQATKDTRSVVNQNTSDIEALQARPDYNTDIEALNKRVDDQNTKIDRMFEKAQYK